MMMARVEEKHLNLHLFTWAAFEKVRQKQKQAVNHIPN